MHNHYGMFYHHHCHKFQHWIFHYYEWIAPMESITFITTTIPNLLCIIELVILFRYHIIHLKLWLIGFLPIVRYWRRHLRSYTNIHRYIWQLVNYFSNLDTLVKPRNNLSIYLDVYELSEFGTKTIFTTWLPRSLRMWVPTYVSHIKISYTTYLWCLPTDVPPSQVEVR